MPSVTRSLIVAAVASMVGVAQAGTITSTPYTVTTQAAVCTGTAGTVSTTTTGACQKLSDSFSYIQYCDASGIYEATYSDGVCGAANVQGMSKEPLGECTYRSKSGTGSFTYQTLACTTADTSIPSFPPSGFGVSNQYQNRTDGRSAKTCDLGAEVYLAQSAIKGGCTTFGASTGQSRQTFANNNYGAGVTYSDTTCTNLVSAQISPISCADGVSIDSFGNIAGIPDNLPATGTAEYVDGDETCAQAPEGITLVKEGACISGSTFVCQKNGAEANVTRYNNQDCTGEIMGSFAYAAGSSAAPGACLNRRRFFCSFDSSQYAGSSASTIAVGVASFALAALVAAFQL
jgi:hypothetical protein